MENIIPAIKFLLTALTVSAYIIVSLTTRQSAQKGYHMPHTTASTAPTLNLRAIPTAIGAAFKRIARAIKGPTHDWVYSTATGPARRTCAQCGSVEEYDQGGMEGGVWITVEEGKRHAHAND